MIRAITFEVPTRQAAEELIKLCRAEGWTVDEEADVFHYEQGELITLAADRPPALMPETYSVVIAHQADLDHSDWAVRAKAAELAAKVCGECIGGG